MCFECIRLISMSKIYKLKLNESLEVKELIENRRCKMGKSQKKQEVVLKIKE